jgi:hypothetical protein
MQKFDWEILFKVVNDVAGNVHCNEKDLEDEVEYVG